MLKRLKKGHELEIEESTIIDGDRSEINVNTRKIDIKKVALLSLFAVLVVASAATVFYIKFGGETEEELPVQVDDAYFEQYVEDNEGVDLSKMKQDFSRYGLTEEEEEVYAEIKDEKEANSNKTTSPSNDNIENQMGNLDQNDNRYSDSIMQRKYNGNILLHNGSESAGNESSGSSQNLDPVSLQSGRGDFLTGSSFSDGVASKSHINRDFLLSSGTNLACVLKTKIVTSYKGIVLCQLSKDVYSDNGKNLLVRAGSLVEGTQTTEMMQGNARVFVVWDRIRDRDTIIRIDALATDTLGASGVPAWVDNHFWQRFGNTILLSFITDAFASLKTHADKSLDAESVSVDNFSSNTSRMAEIALENSINIPPTAYVNQGEKINILVPRNIDFSSIYKNTRY